MRILITGAGGAAAISVWKSLSAEHELHMADMDPLATGLYLVPAERRLIIPRGDSPALVPALHAACRERGIDALLPTVDAELGPVAAARERFESDGIALPISPVECLRICRDKQLLIEAVQGKVPVPGNEPLTEAVAAGIDSFPRFAKPREGAGSRGVAKIDSRADLDKQPKDGSVMLQEYLPGEEYSVDVYVRRDGRVIAAVPRDRMKVDSGIAVASRTVNLPEVIQSAIRTAEIIGIRGMANVQFKRGADGVFKLLEVNPRFPGTLPLTIAAGVDMPKLMVDELMGRPVPDKLMPFKELMVVRYWTEQYFEPREWEVLCRQRSVG
jgi:carbamoyl-phosphate synthase large subunit